MKIVFLADAPYVHTRRWLEHFAGRGHEVHVISFRNADIPGVHVHYIDGFESMGKARYLVHARRVRALIRDLRADLVHALHLTSYGFLAGLAGVQPSIVSVWGTDVLEAPHLTPAHRWITRHALAHAGSITATGLRLAEATLPYTPERKPVSVIPYGADLDLFRPQKRSSKATLTIGTMSRLSPEKGLDVLLRAVALVRERGTVLDVTLAGDGPSRRGLEQLTDELRLRERVRFLGHVEHADVPGVLQGLDIFAVPSTWEGFGVSAVEASAMELPVVASNIHGIPDVVVDGQTGLLVSPSDPEALADAIERLAADAELRAAMGSAGRRYVEQNYRWQDNVRLMESLYVSVTSRVQ